MTERSIFDRSHAIDDLETGGLGAATSPIRDWSVENLDTRGAGTEGSRVCGGYACWAPEVEDLDQRQPQATEMCCMHCGRSEARDLDVRDAGR